MVGDIAWKLFLVQLLAGLRWPYTPGFTVSFKFIEKTSTSEDKRKFMFFLDWSMSFKFC